MLHFHITVLFSFYVIFLFLPYWNIVNQSEEEDAYEWLYDLLMRIYLLNSCHKQKGWIRPCPLLSSSLKDFLFNAVFLTALSHPKRIASRESV